MNSVKAGIFVVVIFLNTTAKGAVDFEWTVVRNPGNGGDIQSQGIFGAVSKIFRISKYAVTNAQYAEFLNAVASTDTFGLYNPNMSSNANGGITRSGVSGSFKYDVKLGHANNPTNYVSFFDAMRFVNWLENRQLVGGQTSGITEDGVYTISNGLSENRRSSAMFFIPSEDEWYKAAYHKNNGITADYWDYPTGTDAIPYSDNPSNLNTPDNSNTGNFSKDDSITNGYDDGLAVTGSTIFDVNQNYLTNVGAYSQSQSPYGTFDQGGVVFEWNEAVVDSARGERGGSWNVGVNWLAASSRLSIGPTNENFDLGFRVASISIPEPSTLLLGALAGIGFLPRRRAGARVALPA